MSKPNGVILYRGPSLIDGAPIVAIATGLTAASSNRKTGAMVQTYILRSDIDPNKAVRTLKDASICGDCPHRGIKGKQRTCYVNVGQGPLGVYRAFKRRRYPKAQYGHGVGRIVRLGTYGDPAAVPADVWLRLLAGSKGHTGYTHQWMHLSGEQLQTMRALCMASVDTVSEARIAQQNGWRTFRVDTTRVIGRIVSLGESLCPASAEAGKKLTCAQCLACGGADGRKGSIYIPAHGGFAVMANLKHFDATREVA